MWEAQGIALVISTTAALLAVGAPFALRWWEERGRRKREKKEQLEEHLFFILQHYERRKHKLVEVIKALSGRPSEEQLRIADDYNDSEIVAAYSSHRVKLELLCDAYGISDVSLRGGPRFRPC